MAKRKILTEVNPTTKEVEDILPITHESCVVDDDNVTLGDKIRRLTERVADIENNGVGGGETYDDTEIRGVMQALSVRVGAVELKVANIEQSVEQILSNMSFERVAAPIIMLRNNTATITCETDGATIHYTTDDSNPSASSSVYTGAITLEDGQTIKAVAVKSGMLNSEIVQETYVYVEVVESSFNLENNTLMIETNIGDNVIPGKYTIAFNFADDGLGSIRGTNNTNYQLLLMGSSPTPNQYCLCLTNAANGRLYLITDTNKYINNWASPFSAATSNKVKTLIISDAVYLVYGDGTTQAIQFPSLATYAFNSNQFLNGKFIINAKATVSNNYTNINGITSQETFDAAIANGTIITSENSGGKLVNFIMIPNSAYTNMDDVLANRADAVIDIVTDSNGVPTNQGTGGGSVYYTKN